MLIQKKILVLTDLNSFFQKTNLLLQHIICYYTRDFVKTENNVPPKQIYDKCRLQCTLITSIEKRNKFGLYTNKQNVSTHKNKMTKTNLQNLQVILF